MNRPKQVRETRDDDLLGSIVAAVILFILYASIGILFFVNGKIALTVVWMCIVPVLAWWFVTKKK